MAIGSGAALNATNSLIDRVIQLLQWRARRRHALVSDYVDPLFAAFQAVHREYLASFAQYRDSIAGGTPVPEVIERIRKDRIFTWNDRIDVITASAERGDDNVQSLAIAVRDYLALPTAPTQNPMSQVWRNSLIDALQQAVTVGDQSASGGPTLAAAAQGAIDQVATDLQIAYGHVTEEYHKLRAELR